MNGIQTTGLVLAVVAGLFALGAAALGTISVGGSTGSGGPSGNVSIESGKLPWIVLGVAAIGVVLVVAGREQAPRPPGDHAFLRRPTISAPTRRRPSTSASSGAGTFAGGGVGPAFVGALMPPGEDDASRPVIDPPLSQLVPLHVPGEVAAVGAARTFMAPPLLVIVSSPIHIVVLGALGERGSSVTTRLV